MRTLIVGLSLPHVTFDNATFLSAPSFSEYHHVVVDLASVAGSVQDVVDGTGAASTFGGQVVVNGPASAYAFPLADLLEMRRREATRLLETGGRVILIGSPVTAVTGVAEIAGWTNASWLPELPEVAFDALLKPGFGREGAVLTDAEHRFAPFITQLATRIGYRVEADEDVLATCEGGHVFARSQGGAAIGFEFALGGGTAVVLPAINKPDRDRQQIAAGMIQSLDPTEREKATAEQANETTGVN